MLALVSACMTFGYKFSLFSKMTWILTLFILSIIFELFPMTNSTDLETADPCSDHTTIDDDRRHFSRSFRASVCDSDLDPGWYRFLLNGTPAEIPRLCIKNNYCGTRLPYRLDMGGGSLPEVNETVDAYACTTYNIMGLWDCCVLRQRVQIRKCDDFYVYYLVPADRCPVAYCLQQTGEPVASQTTAKTGEAVAEEDSDSLECPDAMHKCHSSRMCGTDVHNNSMIMCSDHNGCGILCDNFPDCLDGSDEVDSICSQFSFLCSEGRFRCPNSQQCYTARCDGSRECDDGYDELNCTVSDENQSSIAMPVQGDSTIASSTIQPSRVSVTVRSWEATSEDTLDLDATGLPTLGPGEDYDYETVHVEHFPIRGQTTVFLEKDLQEQLARILKLYYRTPGPSPRPRRDLGVVPTSLQYNFTAADIVILNQTSNEDNQTVNFVFKVRKPWTDAEEYIPAREIYRILNDPAARSLLVSFLNNVTSVETTLLSSEPSFPPPSSTGASTVDISIHRSYTSVTEPSLTPSFSMSDVTPGVTLEFETSSTQSFSANASVDQWTDFRSTGILLDTSTQNATVELPTAQSISTVMSSYNSSMPSFPSTNDTSFLPEQSQFTDSFNQTSDLFDSQQTAVSGSTIQKSTKLESLAVEVPSDSFTTAMFSELETATIRPSTTLSETMLSSLTTAVSPNSTLPWATSSNQTITQIVQSATPFADSSSVKTSSEGSSEQTTHSSVNATVLVTQSKLNQSTTLAAQGVASLSASNVMTPERSNDSFYTMFKSANSDEMESESPQIQSSEYLSRITETIVRSLTLVASSTVATISTNDQSLSALDTRQVLQLNSSGTTEGKAIPEFRTEMSSSIVSSSPFFSITQTSTLVASSEHSSNSSEEIFPSWGETSRTAQIGSATPSETSTAPPLSSTDQIVQTGLLISPVRVLETLVASLDSRINGLVSSQGEPIVHTPLSVSPVTVLEAVISSSVTRTHETSKFEESVRTFSATAPSTKVFSTSSSSGIYPSVAGQITSSTLGVGLQSSRITGQIQPGGSFPSSSYLPVSHDVLPTPLQSSGEQRHTDGTSPLTLPMSAVNNVSDSVSDIMETVRPSIVEAVDNTSVVVAHANVTTPEEELIVLGIHFGLFLFLVICALVILGTVIFAIIGLHGGRSRRRSWSPYLTDHDTIDLSRKSLPFPRDNAAVESPIPDEEIIKDERGLEEAPTLHIRGSGPYKTEQQSSDDTNDFNSWVVPIDTGETNQGQLKFPWIEDTKL